MLFFNTLQLFAGISLGLIILSFAVVIAGTIVLSAYGALTKVDTRGDR